MYVKIHSTPDEKVDLPNCSKCGSEKVTIIVSTEAGEFAIKCYPCGNTIFNTTFLRNK